MTWGIWLAFLFASHTATNAVSAQGSKQSTHRLLGDFHPGWAEHWMERKMSARSTSYEVVEAQGGLVLRARSADSASALWRMLSLHPIERGTVSWRWKVEKSLTGNDKERNEERGMIMQRGS